MKCPDCKRQEHLTVPHRTIICSKCGCEYDKESGVQISPATQAIEVRTL